MRCTISQIYFGQELYMFQTDSVHHQESQHCIHSNRYLSC